MEGGKIPGNVRKRRVWKYENHKSDTLESIRRRMAAELIYLCNGLFQPVLYPVNYQVWLERFRFCFGVHHLHVHLLCCWLHRRFLSWEDQPKKDHLLRSVPVCRRLVLDRFCIQYSTAVHFLWFDGWCRRRPDLPGLSANCIKMVPWPFRFYFRSGSGRRFLRSFHYESYCPDSHWPCRRTDDLPHFSNCIPDRCWYRSSHDRSLSGGMDSRRLETICWAGKGIKDQRLQHGRNGKNSSILGTASDVHLRKRSRNHDGILYQPDRTASGWPVCDDRCFMCIHYDSG